MKVVDRDAFLKIIARGVWHTTQPEGFEGILQCGAILPEPNIFNEERYIGADGQFPLARYLGGVSLFCLEEYEKDEHGVFDKEQYSKSYSASWRTFIPCRKEWRHAVWIEIDQSQIQRAYISPSDLLEKWKRENLRCHSLMPMIEAAHIGPIPSTSFKRILRVDEAREKKWRVSSEDWC